MKKLIKILLTFFFLIIPLLAQRMPLQTRNNRKKTTTKAIMPKKLENNKTFPTNKPRKNKEQQNKKEIKATKPKKIKLKNKTISNSKKQIIANNQSKENSQEKTEDSFKTTEEQKIYLNFENTQLSNFVNYISEIKNINLIPDKSPNFINARISLTIRNPLTVDGAWNIFLTILEMSGFSIIKVGEVYKIIPKNQKVKQPLPSYINVPLGTLPNSDINIRYVTFLENIDIDKISPILSNMLSPEHNIIKYKDVNGLIITDKSYNIKSAMKVIQELDQTGLQESVVVMNLKRANATDVKTLFDSLIKKTSTHPLARFLMREQDTSQYFSPNTRIIAEPRTNSLILLGNKKSIDKIEKFITTNLDTELKGVESPLHIYELQHTDAKQIQDILEAVTKVSGLGQEAEKYGAVRGGVKYFKSMNFGVDEDGNRLIVSSTDKQDWKLLKKTIKDLDKPQPQVALETLIVTIDLEDNKALGGAIRNKRENQIGKGVNFQPPTFSDTIIKSQTDYNNILGNMLSGISSGLGSTILSFGKDTNVWGFFQAIKRQTNTSVLSESFFMVTNKTPATIIVGQSKNVIFQEAGDDRGYKEEEANTTVKITPQINLDGLIRLKLNITFSEFTANIARAAYGDKLTKTLNNDITLADGQVLVLGGFIKTKVEESANKAPLIGDIPVLGWLFKNKTRNISKEYIFIFISPTIIKPRQTPGYDLYTRMKLHEARDNILETVQTRKVKDPIHNWFFNPTGEDYSHKVVDFANARYQPTTVDIKNDPYYHANKDDDEIEEEINKINDKIKLKNKVAENKLSQKREQLKTLVAKTNLKKNITPKLKTAGVTKQNIKTQLISRLKKRKPIKRKRLA